MTSFPCWLSSFCLFSIPGSPRLEAQDDVTQLDAVAILKVSQARNGLAVHARLLGRRFVVEQEETAAFALDQGVPFLNAHVPEKGNIRALIAAQKVIGLEQRILPALLPAPDYLDRRRLKDALHERGERADARPKDDQADRSAPNMDARSFRAFLQHFDEAEKGAADKAANGAAHRPIGQLAERPGGNPFAQADGQSQEHPAQQSTEAAENGVEINASQKGHAISLLCRLIRRSCRTYWF